MDLSKSIIYYGISLLFQLGISNSETFRQGDAFDFIVVGGGTSGCTVARRLAESRAHKILLIEAGGLPHPNLDIPALAGSYYANPNSVKTYEAVPQQNAARVFNGTISFFGGRLLGGSSGINMMVLNRGSPYDYDNWAKVTDDNSWGYQNILQYFRKMENYHGPHPTDQRGFEGPISVEIRRNAPGLREWLEGGVELGYPVQGPNGPQIESFNQLEFAQKNGKRVSAYNGYIEPILDFTTSSPTKLAFTPTSHPNLFILINTEVHRIIFKNNRGAGVRFATWNNFTGKSIVQFATANKEIILSAGTIESAALLLRSGIGPKSVLTAANIQPIKYLPVGENLHDHPGCHHVFIFGNKSAVLAFPQDLTPEAWSLYKRSGDGPFASSEGAGGQAFITSSVLPIHEKLIGWPDIHLYAYNSNSPRHRRVTSPSSVTGIKEWEVPVMWDSIVSRPKSRGRVTLNLENIDNQPIIDYQYLTHPKDMLVMVEVKLCENTHSMQRLGCRLPHNPVSGCKHLKFRSDSYWECYVTQFTFGTLHPVGTCKMGKDSKDPEAVVDTELRVIGVDGLRVADASIMPAITNANTMTPTYAIAEKAADMILKFWGQTK